MIEQFSNLNDVSEAAARRFVDLSQCCTQINGKFSVALAGGNTPARTYELLAKAPFHDQVDWQNVHVFFGDERCVPLDDPLSNYRMAREKLLDQVAIPANQIHPIPYCERPQESAEQYQATLKKFFGRQPPRFDLVLLGLGDDGHTASLFPGTPVLKETKLWVANIYVAEQNMNRVTMTAPLLNQAANIVFLVSGEAKAEVLRDVIEGDKETTRIPAQLIRPNNGKLYWLVDGQAASQLSAVKKQQ